MALRAVGIVFCGFCLAVAVPAAGQTRPPAGSTELGANLPARPLAAGDLLAISVYGAPELSRSVRVSGDGFIRLPMLTRQIEARGAVPAELEQRVAVVEEDSLEHRPTPPSGGPRRGSGR